MTNLNPKLIYLFGSAAKREIQEGSDLDLCVIFDSVEELKHAQKKLRQISPMSAFSVDLIFYDQATFDQKKLLGGLCMIVSEKGQLLFERDASALLE